MKASAKKLDYQREYRKVNRDRILAYQKSYREKRRSSNPDYMKTYMKQWRNNQKKQDLALTKLMLLYTCDRITVEAVKEILQRICEKYASYYSQQPTPPAAGTQSVG